MKGGLAAACQRLQSGRDEHGAVRRLLEIAAAIDPIIAFVRAGLEALPGPRA